MSNSRECSKRKTPDAENSEPGEKAFKNDGLEKEDNGAFCAIIPSTPTKVPPVYKYLQDMELIHEIAINNEFELQKNNSPEKSLKKRVHDMVHKAFWDHVENKLNANPPDYVPAIQLIEDIKKMILELLMPWQNQLKNQISEVLDIELIKQKIEHGVFDISYYGDYIITLMEKICAPVRDEDVAKLRHQKEVVPLFKSIMETLELMTMDMANFTINQARPYMQQHYTSLEKNNFKKYVEYTREKGQDPLQNTKSWLQRSHKKLTLSPFVPNNEGAMSSETSPLTGNVHPTVNSSVSVTGTVILNTAYLELINWDDLQPYPETMCLDENRFRKFQEQLYKLRLMAGILLVTYNTIGSSISGVSELREQLIQDLTVLLDKLDSKNEKKISEVSLSCSEQVKSVTSTWLKSHGFDELDADKQKMLLGQLQDVFSPQNAVHKLMLKRINDFIYQCISCGNADKVKIPVGLSTVEKELLTLCKSFAHLIRLNFGIYHEYYKEILSVLLESNNDKDSSPAKKTPESSDNSNSEASSNVSSVHQ